MANKSPIRSKIIQKSRILIYDSDKEIVSSYTKLLSKKGHKVFVARSFEECLEKVKKDNIDILLLEYSLIAANLEESILKIRDISTRIRIILFFNEDDTVSRHEILENYPIHGCHDKSEGEDKLLIWLNTVLKVLTIRDLLHQGIATIKSQIKIIEKNKEGLRYIISAMPDTVSQLQPLDKFIRGILIQLNGFIEADNSFFATVDDNEQLILVVGTGEFDMSEREFLNSQAFMKRGDIVFNSIREHKPHIGEHEVCFPLDVKDKLVGLFYLEKKGIPLNELEIEMLRLFASQAAITIENSNLFKLATIDGLTGLFVRRYFLQRFEEVLQFANRYNQPLSLLMLDIDHFKSINDTYGHAEGDFVLSRVADIIRKNVRQTDICGRLGGEEFALILINTPISSAAETAEKIRKAVLSEEFVLAGDRKRVTISIGVTSYLPVTGKALDAGNEVRPLLAKADKALYNAKEDGRNRVVLSD